MKFKFFCLAAFALTCIIGCNKPVPQEEIPAPAPDVQAAPTAPAEPNNPAPAQENAPSQPPQAGIVHDPMNPPVDCPLRKAGMDPTQMKPFEQIEAYIAFLEKPDRVLWQKPNEVVEALNLKGTERILDLGAGSGYFSFPMAQKVPNGRIFAADVEPEMIRHIHHNAMLKGIQNIEIKLIDAVKPEVPENIDLVFMCDVMHHVANPIEWLKGVVAQLPAGARFALIEFHEGEIPQGPPASVKMPKAKLMEITSAAGLTLEREVTELLPYQSFLIFKK